MHLYIPHSFPPLPSPSQRWNSGVKKIDARGKSRLNSDLKTITLLEYPGEKIWRHIVTYSSTCQIYSKVLHNASQGFFGTRLWCILWEKMEE